MEKTKPFDISKHQVMQAFKLVKANKGGAGVDGVSIKEFQLKRYVKVSLDC